MDERRRYSDQERADAMAALAANGGAVALTAAQLGIPERTLYAWANGERHPEAAQSCEQKKAPLADRLEDLAHLLLDDMARPGRRKKSSLKETATAMGIAVDKMQALRQGATAGQRLEIVEEVVASEPASPPDPAPGTTSVPPL